LKEKGWFSKWWDNLSKSKEEKKRELEKKNLLDDEMVFEQEESKLDISATDLSSPNNI